jgi:LysM repeat protein
MAKSNPTDVIDAYRRRQERRSFFTFGDTSKILVLLIILGSLIYALLTGGPDLPALVELKTNTPTFTPSITPTATQTTTITPTPTETPDPENQCDCPEPEVIIITATFEPTKPSTPLPDATETTVIVFTPTATLPPSETFTPTQTFTATASVTPSLTPIQYTVQSGDTLGAIALRFGVTVEAIQAANNLDTTLIYAGQVLQIPRPQ